MFAAVVESRPPCLNPRHICGVAVPAAVRTVAFDHLYTSWIYLAIFTGDPMACDASDTTPGEIVSKNDARSTKAAYFALSMPGVDIR